MEEFDNFFHDKYGYCYYSIPPNENALIYNLYTEPEYRRKGHARKHLQFVIEEIRKSGYTGIIDIKAYPREDSIEYEKLVSFYKSLELNVLNMNKVVFRIEK